jgi:hypothetical protein
MNTIKSIHFLKNMFLREQINAETCRIASGTRAAFDPAAGKHPPLWKNGA